MRLIIAGTRSISDYAANQMGGTQGDIEWRDRPDDWPEASYT